MCVCVYNQDEKTRHSVIQDIILQENLSSPPHDNPDSPDNPDNPQSNKTLDNNNDNLIFELNICLNTLYHILSILPPINRQYTYDHSPIPHNPSTSTTTTATNGKVRPVTFLQALQCEADRLLIRDIAKGIYR